MDARGEEIYGNLKTRIFVADTSSLVSDVTPLFRQGSGWTSNLQISSNGIGGYAGWHRGKWRNEMNSESFETIILSRVPHPIVDRLSIKFPSQLFFFPRCSSLRSVTNARTTELCKDDIRFEIEYWTSCTRRLYLYLYLVHRYREGKEKI